MSEVRMEARRGMKKGAKCIRYKTGPRGKKRCAKFR